MKTFHLQLALCLCSFVLLLSSASCVYSAERIFLEAESFKDLGGWVVDPHSMNQMGSSYVMAHGYGLPVQDAKTALSLAKAGNYSVWIRTRDWTAPWKRGTPAGRFRILINNHELPTVLGTNGPEWSWQKAGTISLPAGKNEIRLHDLTGFNGRCDAIYFTDDPNDVPTNDKTELASLREVLTHTAVQDCRERFDLIVVGGGISGICAATAAARSGCRVLLLQDRDVLGGCNSSEIRVGLGGHINIAPYPKLGEVVREIQPLHGGGGTYSAEYYEDARKEILFRTPNCSCKLLLREHVYAIERNIMNPKRIRAVVSRNTHTGAQTRFFAPLFVDATGDAVLARLAGCEVMYGREARSQFNEINAPMKADRQVMGHSVLWYARHQETPVSFPDIDWAIPFDESKVYYIRGGDWEQEAGQYHDMANETEYIRDYGLLSIYSNWSYIKNRSKRKDAYAHDQLDWVSPIGGKRESYRVVGDYILTQNDLEGQKLLPDHTAAITWDIDLHFPDPDNVKKFGEPFRSCAYHRGFGPPYPVPYRCLYARDCDNLFLAGRHISTSHVAFAAVRVMRTLGMLGEVVGMAASICRKEHALPRDVYTQYYDQLKTMMNQGVPPLPTYHAYDNGYIEKYHFKELGMINISHNPTHLNDRVKDAIGQLGMIHRKEHPQLRTQTGLPVLKIHEPFDFVSNGSPKNDLELVAGSLQFSEGTYELAQNILLSAPENRIIVDSGLVHLFNTLSGTGHTFIKSGKGTLELDFGLQFSGLVRIEQGILQLNARSENTKKIEIDPGAVLFCNARNVLGIYAEEKTLPKDLIVRGELKGPAQDHVNLGNIILEGGKITSLPGRGSDILGNFCFAGKIIAHGQCRISTQRLSFRNDSYTVNGGSGLIDLPAKDDLLEISSAIDSFHGKATLRKDGPGRLILSGPLETAIPIEVRKGILQFSVPMETGSAAVADTLFLSAQGNHVMGDLSMLPGSKIIVDANALGASTKEKPVISVSGKITGDINVELINLSRSNRIDLDRVSITGQPLTKNQRAKLESFLEK
ncbi:MAG: FAD-dependent oxidoreductase [Planctomycetia bacterium]|nr:FAD-dependent oxidoreductase [Planctomycetia bacterium]